MLTSVRTVRAIYPPLALLLVVMAVAGHLGKQPARPPIDSSRSPVRYTVTNLGNDGGRFAYVGACSINDRGRVACEALWVGGGGAFLWEKGRFKKLGSAGIAPGRTLNNRGDVVGWAPVQNGNGPEPHVVIFRVGRMVDTGVPGYGLGIDEKCRVVGVTHFRRRAFLYNGRKTIDLGTLGGLHSTAQQINNRGQIVGTSELASGESRAFLYSNGKMKDLGTLGGKRSFGTAINSRGWVAGFSTTARGAYRAFLFRNGRMEELGRIHGDDTSEPRAINSAGTVVGHSYSYHENGSAVIWTGGQAYDLQDLIPPDSGWTLMAATSINDRGKIVAYGSHKDERGIQSCILTPVKNGRTVPTGNWWRRLF